MPRKPEKIKRSWIPEKKPFDRPVSYQWFYNQTKWRKFSKQYREKNPICVHCEDKGIVTAVDVCDHIRGLGFLLKNNLDPYSEDEVQSLCSRCHNIKTGGESGKTTHFIRRG
ncbi:HNH endonuclease signature motif containing protein [Planktosalinus lacus]|uniref:HNH endonuclease n=1 Tax=Planktosalinus lacus TaxID=1526573 RepID=A0A8J2Y768_9FLAO|nr:HNH endonuclease signature motif containing protein [Planktosalinus lacus]GGD85896.1 hypothetical protein GCM10011312_07380 [Planktosalinus lacus]